MAEGLQGRNRDVAGNSHAPLRLGIVAIRDGGDAGSELPSRHDFVTDFVVTAHV